ARTPPLARRRLRRADVHPPIDLARVGVHHLAAQALGERDCERGLAGGGGTGDGDHRVCIAAPRTFSPRLRRCRHQPRAAAAARTIAANASAFSDAPPTSPPSMSGCAMNSAMLSAVTEPP